MANVESFSIEGKWDWTTETFQITGVIEFLFGCTLYTLDLEESAPPLHPELCISHQIEALLRHVTEHLGKFNNAQLTTKARSDRPII